MVKSRNRINNHRSSSRNNANQQGATQSNSDTYKSYYAGKCLCVFVSWMILGKGINSGNGYFTALALYSLPLLLEYYVQPSCSKIDKIIKYIGIAVNFFIIAVAFLGMSGVISIIEVDKVYSFITSKDFIIKEYQFCDLLYFWFVLGTPVPLSAIEWILKIK